MKEEINSMNNFEQPSSGYIITNFHTIIDSCRKISLPVCVNTARLLVTGLREQDDYLRLYSVCANLYYLSRLVYLDNGQEYKLFANEYEKNIFYMYIESEDEFSQIIRLLKTEDNSIQVLYDDIRPYYDKLIILEAFWCVLLSAEKEEAYLPEFAYAFEYVLNHDKLEYPEFQTELVSEKYPLNYEDFDYKGSVSNYFEQIMGGSF